MRYRPCLQGALGQDKHLQNYPARSNMVASRKKEQNTIGAQMNGREKYVFY